MFTGVSKKFTASVFGIKQPGKKKVASWFLVGLLFDPED
jgi:hypothetical protein